MGHNQCRINFGLQVLRSMHLQKSGCWSRALYLEGLCSQDCRWLLVAIRALKDRAPCHGSGTLPPTVLRTVRAFLSKTDPSTTSPRISSSQIRHYYTSICVCVQMLNVFDHLFMPLFSFIPFLTLMPLLSLVPKLSKAV
jgi:hypothetical protein